MMAALTNKQKEFKGPCIFNSEHEVNLPCFIQNSHG